MSQSMRTYQADVRLDRIGLYLLISALDLFQKSFSQLNYDLFQPLLSCIFFPLFNRISRFADHLLTETQQVNFFYFQNHVICHLCICHQQLLADETHPSAFHICRQGIIRTKIHYKNILLSIFFCWYVFRCCYKRKWIMPLLRKSRCQ